MNKTTTKGYVGWVLGGGGGGGTLKLLLLCIHCEIDIKSQHRSLVQVQNYVAITRTLNCTRNTVEKNINKFITFPLLFHISSLSLHYSFSITSKNTIGARSNLNERTHLPLVNMGLSELLDQDISLLLVLVVRMGHVVKTPVLAEERCDLLILSICEWL